MLDNRIALINKYFNVKFHDYGRPGNSVLATSGYGIGLAIADVFTDIKYFIDIDNYRDAYVDWEAIAVCVSSAKPRAIFMSAYFTIDTPENFNNFLKGVINRPVFIYHGNDSKPLSAFINEVNRHFEQS